MGLRKLGGLGPIKLITRPVMAANTFSCIPVGENVEVPPGMAAWCPASGKPGWTPAPSG